MAHVQKRGDGRWRARYRGPDGRERSQTFDRRSDAERFLTSVESDKLRGRWVDPRLGRMTFALWTEETMATRLNLRASSLARDDSHIRCHLLPAFGQVQLNRIRRPEVQEFVRDLSEGKKLAPRTVRECYRILGGLMRAAVNAGLIPESPCQRVTLPRVTREERRFLSAQELETLAGAIDARYSGLIHAGGYLGLRWGELAGLKRKHIDFLRSQVRIVGSLERVNNGFRYVEETKTLSGKRTIPAPPFLIEQLARHLEHAPSSEFVFPSPTGEPLHYQNFRKRVWNPAVVAAAVTPFTPHGLRHSAAALWIAQGANPVTVQRRMGHKDVRTTLQVYGHLFPEQDDVLTSRMEELRAETLAAYSRPGGAQTLKAVR